jgi:CO/xanthine dehydrogenase FAD-binding subunit
MHIPAFEIHEATSVDDASRLLAAHAPDACVLAGGTDLLVDLKSGRVKTAHVVSIQNIPLLHAISLSDEGLTIGATATLADLDAFVADLPAYRPIADATSQMAATQIRNMATIGGNISSAVPCADLPPILITMNASLALTSTSGERSLELESFITGPRTTARRDDELLNTIFVPTPPKLSGAAYERFALRDGNAIAVAGVAAAVQLDSQGVIRAARISLSAVAPTPGLIESASEALIGRPLNDESLKAASVAAARAAQPICDLRGSAEFRLEIVSVLTRRAVIRAHDRAKEAAQ